ncbi:hypothetical protein GW17_00046879 [Ensete ventricosum]|nr:hypothetical protein GW17_00046879 [Ensete ventricosum]
MPWRQGCAFLSTSSLYGPLRFEEAQSFIGGFYLLVCMHDGRSNHEVPQGVIWSAFSGLSIEPTLRPPCSLKGHKFVVRTPMGPS